MRCSFSTTVCFLFFIFLIVPSGFRQNACGEQCPPGKQLLWYYPDEKLDAKTYTNFSRLLFDDLTVPLAQIGYCLIPYSRLDTLVNSPRSQDALCISVHLDYRHSPQQSIRNDPGEELSVDIYKMIDIVKGGIDHSINRSLLSLPYASDDRTVLRSIFVKKIVENLRTQYICTVSISSDPRGARIKTANGLADITPLEWVVPVGALSIQGSLNKYLPLRKELTLAQPGSYNFYFQMQKRKFYRSKFIYPAIMMLLAAGICYYEDVYYYNQYNKLGEMDFHYNPDNFGSLFHTAQNFERASIISLFAGGLFLGLSFWY
jgi:hypothetical protein